MTKYQRLLTNDQRLITKRPLNNEKVRLIKGKSTKIAVTFRKNKANLSKDKFGAKHFSTRIYERFHPLPKQKNKPNQTQFKANSNPISEKAIINISSFMTSKYEKVGRWRGKKTKPNQTQTNPNLPLMLAYFLWSLPLSLSQRTTHPTRSRGILANLIFCRGSRFHGQLDTASTQHRPAVPLPASRRRA